ncbi:hypothetical protein J6590_098468 [Homalodisca vitripennis]|nr:hypothetical protein J6590_098468 [Homalodisca vitripennis]
MVRVQTYPKAASSPVHSLHRMHWDTAKKINVGSFLGTTSYHLKKFDWKAMVRRVMGKGKLDEGGSDYFIPGHLSCTLTDPCYLYGTLGISFHAKHTLNAQNTNAETTFDVSSLYHHYGFCRDITDSRDKQSSSSSKQYTRRIHLNFLIRLRYHLKQLCPSRVETDERSNELRYPRPTLAKAVAWFLSLFSALLFNRAWRKDHPSLNGEQVEGKDSCHYHDRRPDTRQP